LAAAVQNTNNEGSVLAFSPFSKKKGKKYKNIPGTDFEYLNIIINELFQINNAKFIEKYEKILLTMTNKEELTNVMLIFCIHDLKHFPISREVRMELNDIITHSKMESFWNEKDENRKNKIKEVCDYIGDCEIRLI
jgi:hypothetical protein